MEIIVLTTTKEMDNVISHYKQEINKIRTGRANPAILDAINIRCYGSMDRLSHNARINVEGAHQLVVRPHDRSLVKAITEAITAADLRLQIKTEADAVRLIFPQLTEEIRKSLVKDLAKITEDYKIKIRNVRRDAIHSLKKQELPEDQNKKGEEIIQKLTDIKITELMKVEKNKITELMKI
ncbi:ribosome-recycling factor [Spiroplasma sp. AdecLV25b]|uniref:ribosome-recycling factor n=1 Tax=Spiroplasma sp. AdecLV25b TaxID=3027162 RepID=UPI0027DF13CC|nr:ribosome-recycling factor [Spiroplasma sp. AdecLV25b]